MHNDWAGVTIFAIDVLKHFQGPSCLMEYKPYFYTTEFTLKQ